MYITKLEITNFRCFEHTAFELNYPGRESTDERPGPARLKNVNMFLGDNGSGKSSVFRAAVLGALAPIIPSSGLTADYFVRRPPEISGTLQAPNSVQASIDASVLLSGIDAGVQFAPGVGYAGAPLSEIDLGVRSTVGRCEIYLNGDFESIGAVYNSTDPATWQNIFTNNSPAFFLAAYGANRRSERPEGYSEKSRLPRYQRVAGVFEEQVGLAPFTYARFQLKEAGWFDDARGLLNILVPEGIELTDQTDSQNRPLFDWHGTLLPFSALSDGYRTFIAWVWDLLYQMSSVFPYDGSRNLTDLAGVVIVDEIDLFLHPEWQRLVVGQIAEAFPNLQFMFSSHSPLVAGGLEPANIYVLEPDGVHQYSEQIYGLTPSQVLTSSYFGLSSTRAPGTGTLSDLAKITLGLEDGSSITEQANPSDPPQIPDTVRQMFDQAAAEAEDTHGSDARVFHGEVENA